MLRRPAFATALALALLLALTPVPARAEEEMPGLDRTVDLDLSGPASAFELYRALAETAGLALVFDPALEDRPVEIELKGVTVRQGLERLTRAAGHFVKHLDASTLLVVADTPQNRRLYEELVIRTFYLENTDVKDMMTVLRSLVDAKKITTVEEVNAITLRDTPDRIAIAEQIVRRHEKERAEVEVAAELLVLDRASLPAGEGEGPPLRLAAGELARLKRSPGTRTLAAPRLSAVEGERARLVLGEVVPIPRSVPDEEEGAEGASVSYQDIGLELAVEPRVHGAASEVTLGFHAGLSGLVRGGDTRGMPVVARRTVDSEVRLGDGETCLLSGLLRVEDLGGSRLAVLPLLDSAAEGGRELVLALTVRIVRRPEIGDEDRQAMPVGTEARLAFGHGGE